MAKRERKINEEHVKRDAEICRLYQAGSSIYDLKVSFEISHERIRQILRANGIYKQDRMREENVRDEFLGINLTDADKQALREMAREQGISMSQLSSDAIREKLRQLRGE